MVQVLVLSVLSTVLLVDWPRLVGDSLQVEEPRLLPCLVCYIYPSDVARYIYCK